MTADPRLRLAIDGLTGHICSPDESYRYLVYATMLFPDDEPLRVEAEHFIDSIKNKTTPLTGLAHARTVVSILEQASADNGK